MGKRRSIIILVAIGSVLLCGLIIFLFLEWVKPRVYELAPGRIGQDFRMITGHELPKTTDGLRALFCSGREPAIFVRFKTDADGISYILKAFGGPGIKSSRLDTDRLAVWKAAHMEVFGGWYHVQEKIGVRLFDLDSIESGLLLDQTGDLDTGRAYRILIDDKNNIVYMMAGYLW